MGSAYSSRLIYDEVMSWLLSIYIGATILGAGVTIFDLLGLIGSHEAEGADGHDGADGQDGGDGHDGDEAGAESADAGDHAEDESDGGHPAVYDHQGSVAGHDRPEKRSVILTLLTVMRSTVYFALGFGPVGWFALATSGRAGESLAWSVPVGLLTIVGTRALRRFMRRELNSEISTSELLLEHGQVTVSIGRQEMGRVRVKLGDIYVERYARSSDPEQAIRVGTPVRVTDVSDECIFVEPEE